MSMFFEGDPIPVAADTRVAEAFHRCMLEGNTRLPVLAALLDLLKSCNNNARGKFLNMERRSRDGRMLKARDIRRRERIIRIIESHRSEFEQTIPSTRIVVKYCAKMARFVTKTN
ncbi:unnamed protein product [Cylicocyclus nassatus]|uniref:Uncharacterized protein n=1 Tax=Cylicocyclus nassatus TaxID=53992 RepID=A0AA36GVG3_CYLNA|nr:unnamed protein product [Cylicocyclus nassatus]